MVPAVWEPATIQNTVSVLRQVHQSAVDDKRLSRNPCSDVKVPRRGNRSRGFLKHDQVEPLTGEIGD
jgi:site-specific recombinase XerD